MTFQLSWIFNFIVYISEVFLNMFYSGDTSEPNKNESCSS